MGSPQSPPTDSPPPRSRSWREELREIDFDLVRSLLLREALIAGRSGAWTRLLAWFAFGTTLLAILPALYRAAPSHWRHPSGTEWLHAWALATGAALLVTVVAWTSRRIAREVRAGTLDEILLTASSPADILLSKALATAGLALMLACVALPAATIAAAMGGEGGETVLRLFATLVLIGCVGLCLGMEVACARSGTSVFLGYQLFVLGAVFVGVVSGFIGGPGGPRQLAEHYNPVATLLAACGTAPERWPLGTAILVGMLALFTLLNLRLLRQEWPAAQRLARETSWAGLSRQFVRPLITGFWRDPYGRPLRNPKHLPGMFLHVWWMIPWPMLVLMAVARLNSIAYYGRAWFVLNLWLATVCAAHLACTVVGRERETGRWPDLALLPVRNAQLLVAMLLPSSAMALAHLTMAGFGFAVAALFPPPPAASWLAWGVVTLAALPPAAALIGASVGLRAASYGEARWRITVMFTLLPPLLAVGAGAGIPLHWAAALSPAFGALDGALRGAATPAAWLGTLLYALAGLVCGYLLCTRLRQWALASGSR